MRNIFLYPVEAINAIRTNVWSVILIIVGTVLTLHGQAAVGTSLATGGFAILRSDAAKIEEKQPGPTVPPVPPAPKA